MKHTNPGMECLLCRRPRMLTDIDVICKLQMQTKGSEWNNPTSSRLTSWLPALA